MGGGKRKYNQNIRFRKFHKETKEIELEEEKKAPAPENTQSILELWKKAKEKKEQQAEHKA